MSIPRSPFALSTTSAGMGEIVLSHLPPDQQVLGTFVYQYPLKLIAPDPHRNELGTPVTIAFLLTYGGGLVGGDKINLKLSLEDHTRLVLLTQGSTKIFKSSQPTIVSQQVLNVRIGKGASLCYLPDPSQPFEESVYEQQQTFYVEPDGTSNLLMLDWVSEGRRAHGESWTLWSWKGRNEVREFDESSCGRLLLRDAVMLYEDTLGVGLAAKTDNMGIFGTLIVYGKMYRGVGDFFMQTFADQPRIGAKTWSSEEVGGNAKEQTNPSSATSREGKEDEGVIWSAAKVRGFVLVKFGCADVDRARRWLGGMLRSQGCVEKEFGHQALLCLR